LVDAGSEGDPGERFAWLDDIGRDDPLRLISAFDRQTGQTVSLDIVEPTTDRRRRAALDRAQAASTLRHPDILAIREILGDHDPPLVVRDHDHWPTLAEHLRSDGAWPPHAAIRLTAKIATALDRAHAGGLIHGRLTPAQIRREAAGQPYRIAGLGRPLRPIDVATVELDELRYSAPERLGGAAPDKASDLFAVGLIFYALLTGRHAFDATDRTLLAAQVAEADPTPVGTLAPALPPAVRAVVERAIMPEPGLRFRTGNDFAQALERALSSVKPTDPPATPPKRPGTSPPRRSRLATIGLTRILLFGVAIVGIAGTLYAWLRPQSPVVLRPPVETTRPLPRLADRDAPARTDDPEPWPIDPTAPETPSPAPADWRTFAARLDQRGCTRVEASESGEQTVLFGITDDAALPPVARQQAAAMPAIAATHWSVIEPGTALCQLLDGLAGGSDAPHPRLLRAADGRVPAEYHNGDLLVLDVDAPLGATSANAAARHWHVRVDYWMADGRVAHLVPAADDPPVLEAGQSRRGGDPAAGEWFRFEPPGGTELAVAILSPTPLALGERPRIEPAGDYLNDLQVALRSADPWPEVSVVAIAMVTGDPNRR